MESSSVLTLFVHQYDKSVNLVHVTDIHIRDGSHGFDHLIVFELSKGGNVTFEYASMSEALQALNKIQGIIELYQSPMYPVIVAQEMPDINFNVKP